MNDLREDIFTLMVIHGIDEVEKAIEEFKEHFPTIDISKNPKMFKGLKGMTEAFNPKSRAFTGPSDRNLEEQESTYKPIKLDPDNKGE